MIYCSQCGVSEDDAPDNYLVDITVIIANGEEGFADITQYLCDDCAPAIVLMLQNLKFMDHRHGGINYLEDPDCMAVDQCKTPSEFGNYVVPPPHKHSPVIGIYPPYCEDCDTWIDG